MIILSGFLGVQELCHSTFHLTLAIGTQTHASFCSYFGKCCHYSILIKSQGLRTLFYTIIFLKNELTIINDMKLLVSLIHLSIDHMSFVNLFNGKIWQELSGISSWHLLKPWNSLDKWYKFIDTHTLRNPHGIFKILWRNNTNNRKVFFIGVFKY